MAGNIVNIADKDTDKHNQGDGQRETDRHHRRQPDQVYAGTVRVKKR